MDTILAEFRARSRSSNDPWSATSELETGRHRWRCAPALTCLVLIARRPPAWRLSCPIQTLSRSAAIAGAARMRATIGHAPITIRLLDRRLHVPHIRGR